MEKKGFIAISMLYSFFIVFIAIVFSIMTFYSDNVSNLRLLNKPMVENYNNVKYCSNCDPKVQNYQNIFGEFGAPYMPIGSYVYLPIDNYDGLFMVSGISNNSVYLISDEIANNDSDYNSAVANSTLDAYLSSYNIRNSAVVQSFNVTAGDFKLDHIIKDRFLDKSKTTLTKTELGDNIYNMLNAGEFYRVISKSSSGTIFNGIVIPNCKCGSNTYANYLFNTATSSYNSLTSPSLSTWYNSKCGSTPLTTKTVSECDISIINVSPAASSNFNSGLKLSIELKSDTVVTGGSGSYTNPFILGLAKKDVDDGKPVIGYAYTGNVQIFKAPFAGNYQIEAWGAQGGTISTAITGGKGAYTSGTIYLNAEEKLYIYVGGENSASITATWNGGGVAAASYGKPGGGATDIRLASGTWDDITSLRSRIMVAAGGGGAGQRGGGYGDGSGGAGGGLIGLQGQYGLNVTLNYGQYPGTGGTQVAGGYAAAYNDTAGNGTKTTGTYIGYFGYGGTYQPGGGGGYYGGGGGAHAGAGSGSSFISGYAGVNAVTSAASTVATNNTIHYSGKYFINTSMIAGNEVMPTPFEGTMIGNTGNGYAKITYLGGSSPARTNTKLNNVRYIKSCLNGSSASGVGHWIELQAIKDGVNIAKGKTVTGTSTQHATYVYSRLTDGIIDYATYATPSAITGLQCLTVDLGETYNLDEVALWVYWAAADRIYYDNTLSVGTTNPGSTTTTFLSTILHSYSETVTSQGRHYTAWD